MRKFRRQYDLSYQGTEQTEKFAKPSKTVPDQNLSIAQLLHNHTRGIPSQVKPVVGVYLDTPIPRFKDQTERDDFKEAVKGRQMDIEQIIKAEKAEKAEKAQKEAKKLKSKEGFDKHTEPDTEFHPAPDLE